MHYYRGVFDFRISSRERAAIYYTAHTRRGCLSFDRYDGSSADIVIILLSFYRYNIV